MQSEQWRDVVGYEGSYQVSDHGHVRRHPSSPRPSGSVSPGRAMKQRVTRGYSRVGLRRDGVQREFQVHRLVLVSFVGEPPSPSAQCNHEDGVKTNNRVGNLEWCSAGENIRHAVSTGLKLPLVGDKHPNTRVSDDQVREMRELYRTTPLTKTELGRRFGVGQQHASDIISGRRRKAVLLVRAEQEETP